MFYNNLQFINKFLTIVQKKIIFCKKLILNKYDKLLSNNEKIILFE